jgi:hypothetical protein
MRVYKWNVLRVVVVFIAAVSAAHAAAPKTHPANGKVKIFILAGQSNMVGMGEVKGGPGTMEGCLKAKPKEYGHLADRTGNPLTRNDVWVVNTSYRQQQGWLTVGFGANDHCIGPEYGFGWVMGDYYKDPVVIIKCAWGGRSLSHNFLPPSAGEYPKPEKDGDKGWQYAETVRQVKQITGDLKKYVPGYTGRGYEIVGFGWHQGWNDRINAAAVDVYEQNMVHFIKDMRRDLGIKNLPFVIANTGMGGWDIPEKAPYKKRVEKLMEAQLAVADPKKHPEFKGTVAGVETRDFQKPQSESPSKQNYHWFRNWETYYQIGHAMAEAMIPMVQRP